MTHELNMSYIETALQKRIIAGMINRASGDFTLTADNRFVYYRGLGDFSAALRDLHNDDFEAFKRADYAARAEQYQQQAGYKSHEVVALLNTVTSFKKWVADRTENVGADFADYGTFTKRNMVKGKAKWENMVMFPAAAFGQAVTISLDTLIDLLKVLKSQKCKTVELRAVPIKPQGKNWSALQIRACDSAFTLFSDTVLDFATCPDFTLYAFPALPGGDTAPFPAARGAAKQEEATDLTENEMDTPFGVMVISAGQPEASYKSITQKVYVCAKELISIHRIQYFIEGNFDRHIEQDKPAYEWRGWVSLRRVENCPVSNYNQKGWTINRNCYPTPKAQEHINGLSELVKTWLNDHNTLLDAGQHQAQCELIQRGRDRLKDVLKKVQEHRAELDEMETRLNSGETLTSRQIENLNTSGYHWKF